MIFIMYMLDYIPDASLKHWFLYEKSQNIVETLDCGISNSNQI